MAKAQLRRLLDFLDVDPDNASLRADVFQHALDLGQLTVAEEQTRWSLGRAPFDIAWRHRLATLSMRQSEWREAQALIRSLINEGQRDPVLHFNLAYTQYALGQLDLAMAALEPLVTSHVEELPQALALLLRCYHAKYELQAVLDLFRTHEGPSASPEAFGIASLAALDAGQTKAASDWASTAIQHDPDQHEALVTLASILLANRKSQEAQVLLERALARHPEDGRTWSTLGLVKMQAADLDSAREAFKKALVRMPDHVGTWHGLGWSELFRHDLSAAQAAFEQALAIDRNFAESHGALAVVFALRDRRSESEQEIERAERLDSQSLAPRYARAILSGEVHDKRAFSRIMREALTGREGAQGRSLADVVLAPAGPPP